VAWTLSWSRSCRCRRRRVPGITCPQAADIRWVNLIRASTTTHCLNTDERLVDVPFTVPGGGTTIFGTVTAEPNLTPPGY